MTTVRLGGGDQVRASPEAQAVEIEFTFGSISCFTITIHADDARELAAALLKAADACERMKPK